MASEVLKNIVLISILIVVPIGIKALLKITEEKTKNIENLEVKNAIEKVKDTILQCLQETNQTFVKDLKDNKGFTSEAKEEAFNRTKVRVLEILSKETKEILEKEYENANAFINSAIEAKIWQDKKKDEDK